VLYFIHGKFELVAASIGFGRALSEMPWMKFKVIAEPDYAVFVLNQAIQSMMSTVAANTVTHVTEEMQEQISLAIATATKKVTESAMAYAMEQMQVIVQGATIYGKPQRSATGLEHLHIF
jgi:hypothetical protein